MSRARNMGRTRIAVGCVVAGLAGAWLAIGWMQRATAEDVVEEVLRPRAAEGRVAMRDKQWAEAMAYFEEGVEIAIEAGDPEWISHFHFLRGLTHQRAAFEESVFESWAEARDAYRLAVKARPENGAAWNNWAQVAVALGKAAEERDAEDEAKRYFKEARRAFDLALVHGGEKQAQYMANYAGFLQERRLWDECKRLYGELLAQNPNDHLVLGWASDVYRQAKDANGLAMHLWWLVRQGQPQRAQDVALSTLEAFGDAEWLYDTYRAELLTIIAAALADQVYDPREHRNSEVARRLARLSSDLQPGIVELDALHRGRLRSPDRYRWWRTDWDVKSRQEGLSPAEAFRKLALSLGDWYRAEARDADRSPRGREIRERATRQARAFYEFALTVTSEGPAPAAVERQAALWVDLGDRNQLAELVKQDVGSVHAGPDSNEPASRWQQERYELHRLLGSAVAVARPALEPARADELVIAHYQASVESAKEFNDRARGTAILQVQPSVIQGLETAFRARDDAEAAQRLRVDLARHYAEMEQGHLALTILQPLQTQELSPDLRRNLEFLEIDLAEEAAAPAWRFPTPLARLGGQDLVARERKPVSVTELDRRGSELALFEPERIGSAPPRFEYDVLTRVLLELVTERMQAPATPRGKYLQLEDHTISGGKLLRVEYARQKGTALIDFGEEDSRLEIPFAIRLEGRKPLPDFVYIRAR